MRSRSMLPVLTVALVITACDRGDDQRTDAIRDRDVLAARAELDPAIVAALDDGNAAYREHEYETALEHYQAAIDLDPELAAGWFGIYMAHLALGDVDAAEDAMTQARTHAPGATLMHPDPGIPVPADHPALRDDQP